MKARVTSKGLLIPGELMGNIKKVEIRADKKTRSLLSGKNTLVRVENITPFGIWFFIKRKEYFLDFDIFPYFREQSIRAIQNVSLLHDVHLYWPDIDIDLEIDNLENPEKYPLISKVVPPCAKPAKKKSKTSRDHAIGA